MVVELRKTLELAPNHVEARRLLRMYRPENGDSPLP
jgi:hypothetical protein